MTDGAIETVMERTRQEEIRLVRFLYADHGGIIRGKAAGTARLRERMSSGIGHTVAMMAMSMLDHLQPVAGMGPVGEVRIVPDPDTFVALPYAPGAGAMLADLVKTDGSPWEACPRTFLKQALAELAGEGYSMQAAFEPEFTVGRRETSPAAPSIPDRLIPIDDSLCYSSTGFHQAHNFTMELVAAMEDQGLEVEHYYPELATVSTSSPSGTPTRCAPPTTRCCTGKPSVAWRSGMACGRAWLPSRSPTRPATALTCTPRSSSWGRRARPAGGTRSPTPPTGTACPRSATTSSAACSPTCPPWSR